MTSLRADGLQVALGGTTVLHGITLELRAGWTAIVGPNGAGKSTLLRTLAGLLPVQRGVVWVDDTPIDALPARERARRVAWMAQHGQASGELTVREVVALGRLPHLGLLGAPGEADRRAVDAAMREAECAAWADRPLQHLSGGERQRCLLARALAVGAPALLLDEPTTHLDPPHQAALVRLLRRLGRASTVASVLHDLPLALHADRLVVMRAGRLVAEGRPDDLALHAALREVFDRAIRIDRVGGRFVVLPDLD